MFQYNPTVNNISGEIAARNQMLAAQAMAEATVQDAAIRAEARRRRQQDTQGLMRLGVDIAKTAAGFAIGGPTGAMIASKIPIGSNSGEGIGGMVESIASTFANKKAMEAKDKAYTSFFSRHGKDLGFDPNYLEELKSMSRDDRLSAFDLMTGQPGSWVARDRYAQLYQTPRAGGPSGGGGGGGQPFFTVR